MRRKDLEVDGLAVDALVRSRNPCRLVLDLALDITEIVESPVRDVVKLGPLVRGGLVGIPVARLRVILALFTRNVDQLEDERSPSDDAAATG